MISFKDGRDVLGRSLPSQIHTEHEQVALRSREMLEFGLLGLSFESPSMKKMMEMLKEASIRKKRLSDSAIRGYRKKK